jgi:hypothetical protein
MHEFHKANHAWENVAVHPPLTVEGQASLESARELRTSNPTQILEREIQEIPIMKEEEDMTRKKKGKISPK